MISLTTFQFPDVSLISRLSANPDLTLYNFSLFVCAMLTFVSVDCGLVVLTNDYKLKVELFLNYNSFVWLMRPQNP